MGDNPTSDRAHPVVIEGNQSSRAIVQLQAWIKQRIGNAILSKLRTYGANNHPLCLHSLNNEPANHHIVASLHECARGDVTKLRWNRGRLRTVPPAGVTCSRAIPPAPDTPFAVAPHCRVR